MLSALCMTLSLAAQTIAPTPLPATTKPPDLPTTAPQARLRVLVLDLAAESGVSDGLVHTVSGIVSAELATYPELDVTSDADVKRMMELEGEKQAVGCGDSSCLAELAGAIGARLVVFGSIGKLGDDIVMHLNLFDSVKAASGGRQFVQVQDPTTLPTELHPKIRALLERTYAENGLALPPLRAPPPPPVVASTTEPAPVPPSGGISPWVIIGGSAAAVVVGAAVLSIGSLPRIGYATSLDSYQSAVSDLDTAKAAAQREQGLADAQAWNSWGVSMVAAGSTLATVGLVGIVVGGAQLAVGE